MANITNSLDSYLSANLNGPFSVYFSTAVVSTTNTAVAGRMAMRKFSELVTLPTVGGSVTNILITQAMAMSEAIGATMVVQETNFGTLTYSGNSWSGTGTSMPTKTVSSSSIQTNSSFTPVVVLTATTATTPTITVTYTNQSGTGSRTATLVMPTNAAQGTVLNLNNYLQAGDIAVRSIQSVSTSAGSAGTIGIFGTLPVYLDANVGSQHGNAEPLVEPIPVYNFQGGESIAFYNTTVGNNNPVSVGLTAIGA